MTYVTGSIGADVIVMYICFIAAWDRLAQHLEVSRDRRRGLLDKALQSLRACSKSMPLSSAPIYS